MHGSYLFLNGRCHFSEHNKTILMGGNSCNIADRCIRVTIHHCFFDGTRQRHPRVRFGKVHLYNNYTRNWGIYAVCASVESQVWINPTSESGMHAEKSCKACKCMCPLLNLMDLLFSSIQILSQCNIYEAGEKKTVFKYLIEKVPVIQTRTFDINYCQITKQAPYWIRCCGVWAGRR